MVLAAHELPDPGGTGSSAVAAPPGAGAVALAVPAVVLLLTAWSTRHGRRTGALVALAASSAVGYLAAGAVLARDRPATTEGGAPPHLLALAVLLLAACVAIAAWRALPAGSVTLERRTRVLVGALLLAAVWGLLWARHLPVEPVAGELPVRGAGALADLAVLPAAAAAGGGPFARAAWAGKATFASAGCLALAGSFRSARCGPRPSPGARGRRRPPPGRRRSWGSPPSSPPCCAGPPSSAPAGSTGAGCPPPRRLRLLLPAPGSCPCPGAPRRTPCRGPAPGRRPSRRGGHADPGPGPPVAA